MLLSPSLLGDAMRRGFRPVFVSFVLGLTAIAIAGTVTHTSTGDWNDGTETNIDIGNRLELTLVDNNVDDWIRHPYDGVNFEAQGSKNSGNPYFTDGDRCLRDTDNGAINGPTETINGHEFRTGLATTNISGTNYVSTLPPNTLIPVPTGMANVDQVRFITGGARIASANYVVRFYYDDATNNAVTVPIDVDTVLGASRDASGLRYSIEGITDLTVNTTTTWDADSAGGSDCADDGGDDVLVDNPQPGKTVTDIAFEYTDFTDAAAASGWLGGPLAVSLVTDQSNYDGTFSYRGEYVSASSTASAVDAGTHAIWYSLQWNTSNLAGTDSEILLHLTCGDDDAPANNQLDPGELAVERTYFLHALTSPYTLPIQCSGRYLVYRVEIIDEFNDDPRLLDVAFVFDPDADEDGFGDDGNATANDCDDNNSAAYPGAPEIIGNEVDEDCDTDETCYADNDDDGSRHATNTVNSNNLTCIGVGEGQATDPIDCDDNDAARYVGAFEVVGDDIDQNCDNHDACYRDSDRDGHGTGVVVTAVGLLCQTTQQEAKVNDDCDDGNDDRHPGNPEVTGDNVDQDCNDREFCYVDGDNDNARHDTDTLQTAPGDHNCTGPGEGQATDPIDCDDTDNTVSPLLTEIVGNNKDDDCNNRATCYRDNDDDNARTDVTFQTPPGDLDCNDPGQGVTSDPIDCDDNDNTVSPLLNEVIGNNKDDDCSNDATCYRDDDNDGARTNATFVTAPGDLDCNDANQGVTSDPIDCDDTDDERSPLLTETIGNEKDNDCNGQELCWADADEDGTRDNADTVVSNNESCGQIGEAPTTALVDCDDNDDEAFPGNAETIGNENDNDCDGVEICYLDNDNDGYRHPSDTINSTANENCSNFREARFDEIEDCDDDVATTNPGAPDICGNGVDDNCDTVGNNGGPSFLDDDNDGLFYADEIANGTDDCDADSDNDNLNDYDEVVVIGSNPTNRDSDGDSRNDDVEVSGNINDPPDFDGDDLEDWEDPDDDNDGIPTLQEVSDPNGGDGDGVPNFFDDDSDGDGYTDNYEWTVLSLGLRDMDGDGRNNYVDNDSDNDTLLDGDELGSQLSPSDYDGDGIPDRLDDDDDDDCVKTADEIGDPTPGLHSNFDGDGEVDYLDDDDDNDGEMSCFEDPNLNGDPADDDTDRDGQPNHKDDDDDGDLIPTFEENSQAAGRDVDGDGLVNSIDTDSDEDGWDDVDETNLGVLVFSDLDPDPDFLDLDSEGDLVPDDREGSSASQIDTDGDGIIDRLDTDDDDDLIPTAEECSNACGTIQPWDDDFDGDGFPDYIDFDDDNDGVDTRLEDVDGDGTRATTTPTPTTSTATCPPTTSTPTTTATACSPSPRTTTASPAPTPTTPTATATRTTSTRTTTGTRCTPSTRPSGTTARRGSRAATIPATTTPTATASRTTATRTTTTTTSTPCARSPSGSTTSPPTATATSSSTARSGTTSSTSTCSWSRARPSPRRSTATPTTG